MHIASSRPAFSQSRLGAHRTNVQGEIFPRAIEDTEHPPGADGLEIVGVIADRLRALLSVLAELRTDEELALATQVLAEAALLVAGELGLEGNFTS